MNASSNQASTKNGVWVIDTMPFFSAENLIPAPERIAYPGVLDEVCPEGRP